MKTQIVFFSKASKVEASYFVKIENGEIKQEFLAGGGKDI